jgi:hypothetical protein
VELRKKDTYMSPSLDLLFKKGLLHTEVILLAEKASHATLCIFNRTDGGALHMPYVMKVKPLLFQCLLETLHFTLVGHYFLGFAIELGMGIIQWNHSVSLLALPAAI